MNDIISKGKNRNPSKEKYNFKILRLKKIEVQMEGYPLAME